MEPLYARLAALEQQGEAFVLVTVLAVQGSTPRAAGTKMVVTRQESFATIGGGQLEFTAIETARQLLDGSASQPVQRKYPLGPTLGQCCGGQVELLYEVVRPAGLRLAVFGAGHVARALVAVLADVPCRVRWIDPRAEEFPAQVPPQVTVCVTERLEAEMAALPSGTLVLIMTHNHPLDLALAGVALKRDDLPYVGLIGSATKRARFERRLRDAGIGAGALARLVCPIGLPGISGKEPGVIAVAVAAQLLQMAEYLAENFRTADTAAPPAVRRWRQEEHPWIAPPAD